MLEYPFFFCKLHHFRALENALFSIMKCSIFQKIIVNLLQKAIWGRLQLYSIKWDKHLKLAIFSNNKMVLLFYKCNKFAITAISLYHNLFTFSVLPSISCSIIWLRPCEVTNSGQHSTLLRCWIIYGCRNL